MKTVIYLRKSRAEETDLENTLQRHKEILLNYAKENKLNIITIYEEIASGESLSARLEMQKLLDAAEDKNFDAVLCMEWQRLGRGNMEEQGLILRILKENNIKIITPNKIYDLNKEADEDYSELQAFFSRWEYKAIKRRMQRGIKKTIEEGYHIAEPPFGYQRVYKDKKPTLETIPEQAEIVKMVFDLYVNHKQGSHTIANTLNTMGVAPRKGNSFSRSTVRYILTNEIYCGKIIWNKLKHIRKKAKDDKNILKTNPINEWVVVEGMHPAIIDQEIFDKAKEIRKSRSHPPAYKGILENPLAGLIICSECGKTMLRQYLKRNYNKPRLLCATTNCSRSTHIHLIEKRILESLENVFKSYGYENKSTTQINNSAQKTNLEKIINGIEKELTTVENQKNKLHDLLEQGVYDIPTFTKRTEQLCKKSQELLNKLDLYNNELKENLKQSNNNFIPKLENLLKSYAECTATEKNLLLKSVIEKVYYSKTKSQWDDDFNLDISLKYNF